MRIVLDENVDVALKGYLTFLGHEACSAQDAGLVGLDNGAFIAKARETCDLLITNDKDFLFQRRLRPAKTLGIVVLRLGSTRFEEQYKAIEKLFASGNPRRLIGRLTVIR